ncbi:MAG: phosphatase domain-containing protein [Pseudobdellovibrionaceae bacterium]
MKKLFFKINSLMIFLTAFNLNSLVFAKNDLQSDDVQIILISDIDDTIESSHIRGSFLDKVGHLLNYHDGFFGMAPLYRSLAENGVQVIYVSGMPTLINDVSEGASEFLAAEGFPGEYVLRSSALEEDTYTFKVKTITAILEQQKKKFPNKKIHVIAPGDNGEQDIKVLETIRKNFPDVELDAYIHKIYERGVLKIQPDQMPFFTAADLAVQIYNSQINHEKKILNLSQIENVIDEVQKGLSDKDPDTRALVIPEWSELTAQDKQQVKNIMSTAPEDLSQKSTSLTTSILGRIKEIGTVGSSKGRLSKPKKQNLKGDAQSSNLCENVLTS